MQTQPSRVWLKFARPSRPPLNPKFLKSPTLVFYGKYISFKIIRNSFCYSTWVAVPNSFFGKNGCVGTNKSCRTFSNQVLKLAGIPNYGIGLLAVGVLRALLLQIFKFLKSEFGFDSRLVFPGGRTKRMSEPF
jgi:hypothetical protein